MAQVAEDLQGGGVDGLPLLCGGVDGREWQGLVLLHQLIGIVDEGDQPFRGGDHFGYPDALVVVGVDQGEGTVVDFHTKDRTAQRRPKFLVERRQVGQVGPGLQVHPVLPANTGKLPNMFSLCGIQQVG